MMLRPMTTEPPAAGNDDAAILWEAGAAIYGERWQSSLARDLGVAVRTMQRWAVGDQPVPAGAWRDIERLLSARGQTIKAVLRRLPRPPPGPDP